MTARTEAQDALQPHARSQTWIFLVWLAVFYAGWLALVVGADHWHTVREHWPIALAMALGSYVAGSTPMGGGTVGFPVLVLLFHQEPTLGRDFSFAVQSIGMTSASIFIIATRRRVAWRMLGWSMVGSLVGTPLGLIFFAPHVSGVFIKLLFAVVWASFGIMTIVKLREIAAREGSTPTTERFDRLSGLAIGLLGGAFVASITGVGIDMLIYTMLVLVVRADLKMAIPTSVVLMAFTSLVGLAVQNLTGQIRPGVFGNWLAAAPVVALGAPLGAMVVELVGRRPTLQVVAVLCLMQFVWTCHEEWSNLGMTGLGVAIAGLLLFNAVFHILYKWGERLAHLPPPAAPSRVQSADWAPLPTGADELAE